MEVTNIQPSSEEKTTTTHHDPDNYVDAGVVGRYLGACVGCIIRTVLRVFVRC